MFVDIFNTDKKYQIIYADPPWKYTSKSVSPNREVTNHYQTMAIGDMKDLPLSLIQERDCYIFTWVTCPNLDIGIELIKSWGFDYKTVAFTWVKMNKNGAGIFTGLGAYTRTNSELCLLGTKGHLEIKSHSISQVIITPIMAHSRKPDEIVRDNIVALCGDLPRIELFARRQVEGWDCWGDQC